MSPQQAGAAGEEGTPSLDGAAPTGLDAVDRVLARAAGIEELPVTQRAEAFAELHGELERILAQDPASLPAGLAPGAPGPSAGSGAAGEATAGPGAPAPGPRESLGGAGGQ